MGKLSTSGYRSRSRHADLATGAAAFSPISGVAWDRAYWAEGAEFIAKGYADGATVTNWPDEIGTADLTTLAGTAIYRSSGTGWSLPCVDFDGVDDMLQCTFTLGLPNTVLVIATWDSVASNNRYLIEGKDGTHRRLIRSILAGTTWDHYAGVAASGGTATTGKHAHRSKIVSGTSDSLHVDGVSITTATAGDQTMTGMTVGGPFDATANASFDGRVVFIGVYPGDLTADGGYAALQSWATTKYGVTI